MSWKEIEVKSISELKPDGKYRVKVGETWWPCKRSVDGNWWAGQLDATFITLDRLVTAGCSVEGLVDEGPRRWEGRMTAEWQYEASHSGVMKFHQLTVYADDGTCPVRNGTPVVVIEKRENERVVVINLEDIAEISEENHSPFTAAFIVNKDGGE